MLRENVTRQNVTDKCHEENVTDNIMVKMSRTKYRGLHFVDKIL